MPARVLPRVQMDKTHTCSHSIPSTTFILTRIVLIKRFDCIKILRHHISCEKSLLKRLSRCWERHSCQKVADGSDLHQMSVLLLQCVFQEETKLRRACLYEQITARIVAIRVINMCASQDYCNKTASMASRKIHLQPIWKNIDHISLFISFKILDSRCEKWRQTRQSALVSGQCADVFPSINTNVNIH